LKTTLASEAIRQKMIASGRYIPLDSEEYKQLLEKNAAEIRKIEHASYTPDYTRFGITAAEGTLTWSAVKPGLSDGYKAMQIIKKAYERGWGMIFLWGTWGQGKTLLGKIVAATGFRDQKKSSYTNMSSVLDDIRLAFDEKENKTTELLRKMEWWSSRDVLFLDELDKVNGTAWAEERIHQLLDTRYTMAVREQALTIIASNTGTDELDGYLVSRLYDRRISNVIHVNGPDARKVVGDDWKF